MVLFGPSIARLAPLREKRWLDAFARRYQRFLLQGMGRRVLSRQARGQGHARALRDAITDRRDQQHVLSDAERDVDPRLAFPVPDSFRFAIKVPRRISHIKRLRDCGEELGFLLRALADLSPCLGSLLVQLPPHARCDEAALTGFLHQVPEGTRVAFEFRNDSWHVPAVFKLLESRNAALVQSESDETFEPLPWTADWAYLRLRKVDYTDADLVTWLERLRTGRLESAHVYFKHEDGATGPKLAAKFLKLAA